MADLRFLISPTPEEVEEALQEAIASAKAALAEGNMDAAVASVDRLYYWMLQRQPEGRRYHKGWPLHQLGMFRLQQEQFSEARHYFLLAFVEDSLSRGEESPNRIDEIHRPAALNLVYGFGVAGSQLVDLSLRLRGRQAEGQLLRDPAVALEHEPLEPAVEASGLGTEAAEELESPVAEREPEWRRVSEFGVPWEDRVFVGGAYRTHFATLRIIRDEVRRNGLDGVLVAEFRGPSWMTPRNKSLTLLKACRRAIFEISKAAGQLVEFDRTLDYEIDDVLVVYHSDEDKHEISSMATSLFGPVKVTLKSYDDAAHLRTIVTKWLQRRRRRSSASPS